MLQLEGQYTQQWSYANARRSSVGLVQ